ncbi:MAG: TlpA family protein disulfide reductase [Planctomycetota bacterium]
MLVLAIASPAHAQNDNTPSPDAPQPGDIAPDFTLPDLHDAPHTLAELRGNCVLVMFWASWVPGCVHMGDAHLLRIENALRDRPFRVLTIGGSYRDRPERQQAIIDERGWDWLSLYDDGLKVTTRYGVTNFGWLVLLDENGRIIAQGDSHDTLAEIEAWLNQHFHTTIATASHAPQGPGPFEAALTFILQATVVGLALLVLGLGVRQRQQRKRAAHGP